MKYRSLLILFLTTISLYSQTDIPKVNIVGAMRNVMWKGQLHGTISLDTINDKKHLYGIGPVEGLTGELLVLDGKSYRSSVVSGTEMKVEETYNVKAPFFVYANVKRWNEIRLPETVRNLTDLENYLIKLDFGSGAPFPFMLKGTVQTSVIHVVNLPAGATVSSPDEAHRGQVNYTLKNARVEMLGFFSKNHQSVFTHHDTFMHLHLITEDKKQMGHLDSLTIAPGTLLYLPQ